MNTSMSAFELGDLLFTLIVFAAILLLFTEYAEYVVGALLLAVIWQFVQVFGPSLFLATLLVFIFVALRAIAMVARRDGASPVLARFLDELLTRPDRPGRDPPDRGPRDERLDLDVRNIDDYQR